MKKLKLEVNLNNVLNNEAAENSRVLEGKIIMNTRDHDDEDYNEPKQEPSEWDEWKQDDDARRYREYQSDNNRPY